MHPLHRCIVRENGELVACFVKKLLHMYGMFGALCCTMLYLAMLREIATLGGDWSRKVVRQSSGPEVVRRHSLLREWSVLACTLKQTDATETPRPMLGIHLGNEYRFVRE